MFLSRQSANVHEELVPYIRPIKINTEMMRTVNRFLHARDSLPCFILCRREISFISCSPQTRPNSFHVTLLSQISPRRESHKVSSLPPSAAASVLLNQSGIQLPERCCGCGIKLQQTQPEGPGYFIVPAKLVQIAAERKGTSAPASPSSIRAVPSSVEHDEDADIMADADDDEDEYSKGKKDLEKQIIESRLMKKPQEGIADFSPSLTDDELPDVVCQRCYSLKHKGSVEVESAEGLLPEFDLGKKVGRKIFLQKDRKAVVLCVVDVWDFDGSLPR